MASLSAGRRRSARAFRRKDRSDRSTCSCSSAESRNSSLVPSVQANAEEMKLMDRLRDDVAGKLGARVLLDTKNRAAFAGGTGGAAAGLGPM